MSAKIFISSCSNEFRDLRSDIAGFLNAHAYNCWYDRAIEMGENWAEQIQSKIAASDAVLVIFSRGYDANIAFEAGMAAGAGKQLILVAPTNAEMPFGLKNYPIVFFDPATIQAEDCVSRVCKSLERFRLHKHHKPQRKISSAKKTLQEALGSSNSLDELDPMLFEELVEKMLCERGWLIQNKAENEDHGYDFVARPPGSLSCELFVECKKLSSQKMVGMEPVLRLANAVRLSEAAQGLLVTTAPLTASAKGFVEATKDRLLVVTVDDLINSPDKIMKFCAKRSRSKKKKVPKD